jgi:transposase-like protein
MDTLKTLQQAIIYFSDANRAFQYALNFRWQNGLVTCPRCNGEKHSFIKTRKVWFCYDCNKQFSLKVGTIFEDSPITLDKWMLAMWMLANCKNGVSSHEMGRTIGVTQRTAWFMLHRIRKAMETGVYGGELGGGGEPVEVDESFVGGEPKNWHKAKRESHRKTVRSARVQEYQNRFTHKTSVIGMLDRESRQIRAKVVPNVKRDTLQKEILCTIKPGSKVYTDQAVAYTSLQKTYIHETVNHAIEYVRGEVHTNGLESFWSLLKRNLAGTYVAVEPFHLDRYLAEQVFRYNHRKDWNDQGRFELALSSIGGKRLTYAELTGVGAATSH